MRPQLLELLNERLLLCDGAMGTRLQALARNFDGCLDAFNIDKDSSIRGWVRNVHEGYADAGVDILQTNTFGANPVKLARFGLEDKVKKINREGARMARDVAGEKILVGGSIGPMEQIVELETWSQAEIESGFREQMEALVEGGVDFFILETFQELKQAQIAVSLAKSYKIPVLFQMGGVHDGKTSTGIDVVTFATEMEKVGADIIGTNCRGPFDVLRSTEILASHLTAPISAQPNAGSPEIDRGRIAFVIQPESFVQYAERIVNAGANIIGGCCGTELDHIVRLRELIDNRKPVKRSFRRVHVSSPKPETKDDHPVPNRVQELMDSDRPLVSVEIRAPRSALFSSLLAGAQKMVEAGATLLDVPDNAGGMVGYDPMTTASYIQDHTGIPTIMHLNSTSRNLIALQSYLMGVWQQGIQSILAISGDHPNVGDHDKYAHRVTDIKSSVDLIKVIKLLNNGKLFNEKPIRTSCNFNIGGAVNPNRNLKPQFNWLKRKIEAGASYAFSQPVYLADDAKRMYEYAADIDIPIFTGILPIASPRNAEFLASGKIPGMFVPPKILQRFLDTNSREEARSLGLKLSENLLQELEGVAQGFYFILPFGKSKYEDTASLVKIAVDVLNRKK